MNTQIRLATNADIDALNALDLHVDEEILRQKVSRQEVIVCDDGEITGLLRYGWLWDILPFINFIYVKDDYRRKGRARSMIERLIKETRGRNRGMLMTSTQSDEEAQFFWRKVGFVDAGGFVIRTEPLELVMIRYLAET